MNNKALTFSELHSSDEIFIMANAWNAGSAILLEEAGFSSIGTTSAGIAYSLGVADSQGDLDFDTALDETQRIAAAVNIPVSMDAENGYGDSPGYVFSNVTRIIETGVVGASIEDFTGDKSHPLYDIELATDRIRAAKQATENLKYPFVLTARAECYLVGHGDPFEESLKRVNRYREAGADCLFVPGIKDIETISKLVTEVDGPISVVMGLSGTPISVAELQDAGVSRISIGGSLARATFGFVRNAAKEMLDQGSFLYSGEQIPDGELCSLFTDRKQGRHND
jgi:2-methylisocitrate lyase-like PEP mutase family enzyme